MSGVRRVARVRPEVFAGIAMVAMQTVGVLMATPSPALAQAQTSLAAPELREGHREAAIARRADFMQRMEGGIAVITSADRSQPTAR